MIDNMKAALEALELQVPRIKKGMTQADADSFLLAWKEKELKEALREGQKKWHPDRNSSQEAEDRFKQLEPAYTYIKTRLVLRVPVTAAIACSQCNAARLPADAPFCHACGQSYFVQPPATHCPCCKSERVGVPGNYCYNCGFMFPVDDPLTARLIKAGLRKETIQRLEKAGIMARWSETSPLSPSLEAEIQEAVRDQRANPQFWSRG